VKFVLIDKLVKVQPGQSALATKSISLAEEYLADHFPTFPVLPGVLMVQAMTETSAWLVRLTQNFANSVILLSEAKNVSYGTFVSPGDTIEVLSQAIRIEDKISSFKTQCTIGSQTVAKARLTLEHFNISERFPSWQEQDKKLIEHFRSQLKLLASEEIITSI